MISAVHKRIHFVESWCMFSNETLHLIVCEFSCTHCLTEKLNSSHIRSREELRKRGVRLRGWILFKTFFFLHENPPQTNPNSLAVTNPSTNTQPESPNDAVISPMESSGVPNSVILQSNQMTNTGLGCPLHINSNP